MTLIMLPQDALCLKTKFGFSLVERELEKMCESICAVGLLNPLIVTRDRGRYIIVDGKTRFQAIKKLAHMYKLPRTLNKVPCLLTENDPIAGLSDEKPMLLSEQDLVHEILCLNRNGVQDPEIGAQLYCSDKIINQARSLQRLHPKLMQAFINSTVNLAQASALSTMPNIEAQWDLLIKLGPFASVPEIITAIAKGETVLELPNGDIMILPSRAPSPQLAPQAADVHYEAFQMAA